MSLPITQSACSTDLKGQMDRLGACMGGCVLAVMVNKGKESRSMDEAAPGGSLLDAVDPPVSDPRYSLNLGGRDKLTLLCKVGSNSHIV